MFRLVKRFRSAPAPASLSARPAVDFAGLLGRQPINLDTPELQRFLAGKRVLVTGAGGSIGSEICRQTMRFCPERLVLLERAENALFEIDRELRHTWVGADIRPCIGDVCDARRVRQVFDAERPQVVFHCAAHKHVPMMEAHPCEAIKNNVFGTKTVADACSDSGVAAFVLVSTDKAVNPTSVMGATKRVAELYVQSLNEGSGFGVQGSGGGEQAALAPVAGVSRNGRKTTCVPVFGPVAGSGRKTTCVPVSSPVAGSCRDVEPRGLAPRTRFVAVRFGNVLGSSGSVVPIFQKQIEAGGPLTVTHPDMKRYFMMIPEASQLVMQAGAIGGGGEIFVLDMGAQVRIVDLATALIRHNGLRPNDDIEIRFTGIRPGEKLYEELANDDEQTCATAHDKIRVWKLPPAGPRQVARGLELLSNAAETGDALEAIAALARCVPEYQPAIKLPAHGVEAEAEQPLLRLASPDVEAA